MRRSQGAPTRDTVVARIVLDPGPCVSGGTPSVPTFTPERQTPANIPPLVSPPTTAGTPTEKTQFGVTPKTAHVGNIATHFQVCYSPATDWPRCQIETTLPSADLWPRAALFTARFADSPAHTTSGHGNLPHLLRHSIAVKLPDAAA